MKVTPYIYHQVDVNQQSREKLAFVGPDAKMFTYRVLIFGPVNGPFVFITMILDLNSGLQILAAEHGITIGNENNTKIIVDDLFNFCLSEAITFIYMECLFEVAACR